MQNRKVALAALVIGAAVLFALALPGLRESWAVEDLVNRNVAARGGSAAWGRVVALHMTGTMDVGHGMALPYVLDQKRPDKMRLEFTFDGEKALQVTDGTRGWKVVPFLNDRGPQEMTEEELREALDAADPRGLLFEHGSRGIALALLEDETFDGKAVHVLDATLPSGAHRRVLLDAETALEVAVASTRTLAGEERTVVTRYSDWKEVDGLLIPRHLESQTEGDDEAHALVVRNVAVNPPMDDAHFILGAAVRP